ncbi:alpha/beta hydrolase [Streptomyces sp. NPDC057966]|uniref:alpha/beta hydrolase n=1 Tax=Streptomyces sp. NPDC057966 TaxID=3346292 RepID=UPI0036EE026C
MPLHPEIAKVLAVLPPAPQGPLDPAAMRAAEEQDVVPADERLPLHAVEEMTARTPSGEVPVRVYTPAEETGLKVVSVGYCLAPEAAFPAGLDDCYAVLRWAAEHGETFAWDRTTLAVAGDSSGGTYAAVAARAHDDGFHHITHQILYYPSLDLDFDTDRYPSLCENAVGHGLETAGLKPFNAFYFGSGADPADPLVYPIKRTDLGGLPPVLVVTGECDPLRDEGELYARRIWEAGGKATVSRYAGAGHGFVQHFSWIPEYHRVFAETSAFLGRR